MKLDKQRPILFQHIVLFWQYCQISGANWMRISAVAAVLLEEDMWKKKFLQLQIISLHLLCAYPPLPLTYKHCCKQSLFSP